MKQLLPVLFPSLFVHVRWNGNVRCLARTQCGTGPGKSTYGGNRNG